MHREEDQHCRVYKIDALAMEQYQRSITRRCLIWPSDLLIRVLRRLQEGNHQNDSLGTCYTLIYQHVMGRNYQVIVGTVCLSKWFLEYRRVQFLEDILGIQSLLGTALFLLNSS